jgi:hypothetical protein
MLRSDDTWLKLFEGLNMVGIILSEKRFYRFFTQFFGRNSFMLLKRLSKENKFKKLENSTKYNLFKLINLGIIERKDHVFIPKIKISKEVEIEEEVLRCIVRNLNDSAKALLLTIYLNQDSGCIRPSSLFREMSRTHIIVRKYFTPKELIGKSQTALWYNLKKLVAAELVKFGEEGIRTTKLGSEIAKIIEEESNFELKREKVLA